MTTGPDAGELDPELDEHADITTVAALSPCDDEPHIVPNAHGVSTGVDVCQYRASTDEGFQGSIRVGQPKDP